MDQDEVNGAITAYFTSGDSQPWLRVLEAIRNGQVLAQPHTHSLTLRANTRPATVNFGRRLTALRAKSRMTLKELADLLDISGSSVIRQMNGQALGAWPVVSMMVTAMGGEPAAYKDDHVAAKAEHGRYQRGITARHGE